MAWLLTWFGQSLALCAVTAALVRLPGFHARAAARAAAWSVALAGIALLALLPLVTWPSTTAAVAGVSASVSVSAPLASAPFVLPAVPARWLALGTIVWALGALAWLAYAVREVLRVARLKRACEPLTPDEQGRVQPWVARMARGRPARLRWCDGLDGPALLGFRHPVIALPRAHGERLSDEELNHVLLHEVAHLRRRDDWASLLEFLVTGILWINPFVHVARRALALAREMACDDWVVQQTAAPVAYARCLTTVADLRQRYGRARLAAAVTGTRSVLSRRITRMLDEHRRPSARASRLLALVTPVAVGILAIGLIQTPPLVVNGTPDSSAVGPATAMREPAPAAPVGHAVQRTLEEQQRPERQSAPRAPAGAVHGRRSTPAPAVPPQTAAPGATAREDDELTGSGLTYSGETVAASPRLSASPLPGVGTPGVPAADSSATAGSIVPNERTPWWGRAARVGAATSEGATTAGRATASFFKRLGSSVSRSLNR